MRKISIDGYRYLVGDEISEVILLFGVNSRAHYKFLQNLVIRDGAFDAKKLLDTLLSYNLPYRFLEDCKHPIRLDKMEVDIAKSLETHYGNYISLGEYAHNRCFNISGTKYYLEIPNNSIELQVDKDRNISGPNRIWLAWGSKHMKLVDKYSNKKMPFIVYDIHEDKLLIKNKKALAELNVLTGAINELNISESGNKSIIAATYYDNGRSIAIEDNYSVFDVGMHRLVDIRSGSTREFNGVIVGVLGGDLVVYNKQFMLYNSKGEQHCTEVEIDCGELSVNLTANGINYVPRFRNGTSSVSHNGLYSNTERDPLSFSNLRLKTDEVIKSVKHIGPRLSNYTDNMGDVVRGVGRTGENPLGMRFSNVFFNGDTLFFSCRDRSNSGTCELGEITEDGKLKPITTVVLPDKFEVLTYEKTDCNNFVGVIASGVHVIKSAFGSNGVCNRPVDGCSVGIIHFKSDGEILDRIEVENWIGRDGIPKLSKTTENSYEMLNAGGLSMGKVDINSDKLNYKEFGNCARLSGSGDTFVMKLHGDAYVQDKYNQEYGWAVVGIGSGKDILAGKIDDLLLEFGNPAYDLNKEDLCVALNDVLGVDIHTDVSIPKDGTSSVLKDGVYLCNSAWAVNLESGLLLCHSTVDSSKVENGRVLPIETDVLYIRSGKMRTEVHRSGKFANCNVKLVSDRSCVISTTPFKSDKIISYTGEYDKFLVDGEARSIIFDVSRFEEGRNMQYLALDKLNKKTKAIGGGIDL